MNFQRCQTMKPKRSSLAIACLLTGSLYAANLATAQARPAMSPATPGLHEVDLGVAGTGQFTTSITNQTAQTNGTPLPHQATTGSAGAMVTLRDRPLSWVRVEVNYQFTHFSERFTTASGSNSVFVPSSVHEFTAAYLLTKSKGSIRPYVAVGGGSLVFEPSAQFHHQWRSTGLFDVGFDFPTCDRIVVQIGAHTLVYRAPNYYNAGFASSRWVATTEPYIGAHYTF